MRRSSRISSSIRSLFSSETSESYVRCKAEFSVVISLIRTDVVTIAKISTVKASAVMMIAAGKEYLALTSTVLSLLSSEKSFA